MAIDKLSLQDESTMKLTPCVSRFLIENVGFEWYTCRIFFLLGLIGFVVMIGMRAWLSLSCPLFGKLSVLLITTFVTLMLAFIFENLKKEGIDFIVIVGQWVKLLCEKLVAGDLLFILFTIFALFTLSYMTYAYNHVYLQAKKEESKKV